MQSQLSTIYDSMSQQQTFNEIEVDTLFVNTLVRADDEAAIDNPIQINPSVVPISSDLAITAKLFYQVTQDKTVEELDTRSSRSTIDLSQESSLIETSMAIEFAPSTQYDLLNIPYIFEPRHSW